MNTQRFAAWLMALVVGFVGLNVQASGSAADVDRAAHETAYAEALGQGRQLGDSELSAVYGAGLEAKPSRLVPTTVAVILWDERTKVRMSDNGTSSGTGSQMVNATLTQR